jgi:hypothetical protein
MLLRIDTETHSARRVEGRQLRDFGLLEQDLQSILFANLERLLPDEELLVVAQSRKWQEEPDILALDEAGRLFIFELKLWEARSENILQALRYGQIFGQYRYDELNALFSQFEDSGRTLAQAHARTFGSDLPTQRFNHQQVFVIVTNGLDFKTREAVHYWRDRGLEVRPWVYRAYRDTKESLLLEMSRFAIADNPYEDVATNYFILNTNYSNDPADHEEMLQKHKAAAYFSPWKHKIEQLSKDDLVFLYQSGTGIVAFGSASGKLEKSSYHGEAQNQDEEFFMELSRFQLVEPPLPAAEVKLVTGRNYSFRGTMFSIDADSASALQDAIAKP